MPVVTPQTKQRQPADGASPVRVHIFVGLLAAVAAVIVAVSVASVLHEPRPHLLMLAAAVAAVFVGDIRLVEIRIGHNGNTFTWSEAALILGVSLTGWSWFILLGVTTLVVRQLLVGRALLKTTFNAAAFATGSVVAELGFILVSGHNITSAADLNLRLAVAWVVAAAIYNWWVSFAVSTVVALVAGRRRSAPSGSAARSFAS